MTKSAHLIELSFRALKSFGEPGMWIWKVGKTIPDLDERADYLYQALAFIRSKTKSGNWIRPPVDFRTFVESEHLLNKPGEMYPEVMRCGSELNSGRYIECVLTGAIGTGKSHLAVYTQAYQVYVLTCMKNPHATFDLDSTSDITVIFQSANKELAKDVDYARFRAVVDESPYFRKYAPYDEGRASDMRFINTRIVCKPISGSATAALGQNVIGGILDELNFMAVVENSKTKRDGTTYDQAIETYNALARRRESRFMQLGELPGMLCLVSSRNYPGQFTDKKELEAKTNPRIYVYDKRRWEIRPEQFCGEKFPVFVGDATRKPIILQDDYKVPERDEHLVVMIPVEYRKQFENDILNSIRDIAGYATLALHPFMLNTDAVAAGFGKVASIASREDCDFVETRVSLYPKRLVNPNELRWVHIDLSLNRDSAGMSIGHCPGFKQCHRGDHIETLPIIQYDMILEIVPPRGGEIDYGAIRKLLYTLRNQMNMPIKWVSFDQFQSNDSRQILQKNGFVTDRISMDTDTGPYDILKQAFYDGRIIAPTHVKALHELTTLEYNAKKAKIDHSPVGSKDISDSMAGVAMGLVKMRDTWQRYGIPLSMIPKGVIEATHRRVASSKINSAKVQTLEAVNVE